MAYRPDGEDAWREVVDPAILARRKERAAALDRRRRRSRRRAVWVAAVLGVLTLAVTAARTLFDSESSPAPSRETGAGPVHVDIGPPQADPARPPPEPAIAGQAVDGAEAARARPVVWIQAGHADPREPGYRAQTGASSGPFGSEIGFTTMLAPKVVARLRRAGVNARLTPGQVTPRAAGGAAFVSLHHDTPEGAAAIGHAISGVGENYYRGEGFGDPSPTPYPDSAPHRPGTTVSTEVERRSRVLARRIDHRLRAIYTSANGARAAYRGVETRTGNPRLMRYYGFYRTRAAARVIVEAGAGTTDDAFLARTALIAEAISQAVVADLRARDRLARSGSR